MLEALTQNAVCARTIQDGTLGACGGRVDGRGACWARHEAREVCRAKHTAAANVGTRAYAIIRLGRVFGQTAPGSTGGAGEASDADRAVEQVAKDFGKKAKA